MIRRHRDSDVLHPPSSPYATLVRVGDEVRLSGVVAADVPGSEKALGSIVAETREVMDAIGAMLREEGLGMQDLVAVQVHLADIDELPAFDSVYARYFPGARYPARTAVGGLALVAGARVEVTAWAKDSGGAPAC